MKSYKHEITKTEDGQASEYMIKEYTERHSEYKERVSQLRAQQQHNASPKIARDKSIPYNVFRDSHLTHYSEFKHPNMMSTISADYIQLDGSQYVPDDAGCLYYFRQFDETILRPLLIYKYKKLKHKPEINFEKLFDNEEKRNKTIAEIVYQ